MVKDGLGVAASNPVSVENLARQVQPLTGGILSQIAQDIRQLQRPAERFCHCVGGIAGVAKNVNRKMADSARYARAIEVESSEVRSPEFLPCVHLHAGDNRAKVFATKAVSLHRLRQRAGHDMAGAATIERIDFLVPSCEGRE